MASVVVLAGGTGGAKLARGMLDVVGDDLTVIANTGDDIEIYGAYVSPDPDLCTFWLADLIDERGWGLRDDSFAVMDGLRDLGVDVWFAVGDRDLAIAIQRRQRLDDGARLTDALAELGTALGLQARVLPMADEPVRTRVRCGERWMSLQEFLIRAGAGAPVSAVELDGVDVALATPEVLAAIAAADAIIVGPSNPVISIGPILAVGRHARSPAGQPGPCRRGVADRRRGRAQGADGAVHGGGRLSANRRGDCVLLRRADRRPRRRRAGRWRAGPAH